MAAGSLRAPESLVNIWLGSLGIMLHILVLVAIVLATTVIGGWYGWRKAALETEVPPGVASTAGMLGRDYGRFVKQQRRRRQFRTAAVWSLIGALSGMLGIAIVAASLAPRG